MVSLERAEADPPVPRRVMLSAAELAHQFGVPPQLFAAYLKRKVLHPASSGERRANLGLLSEELAALAMASHLHGVRNLPMRKARAVVKELIDHLLQALWGDRVTVCLLESNRGFALKVLTGRGPLRVPAMTRRYVTLYDAKALRDRMETAMDLSPLKLPRASDCVVNC